MAFRKIYIELTNRCGLECEFCTEGRKGYTDLKLETFESILQQCSHGTGLIAYHILGDPLLVDNFKDYLDVTARYGLKGELVTSGFYFGRHPVQTFRHPALKQIRVSLDSLSDSMGLDRLEKYWESLKGFLDSREAGTTPFVNLGLIRPTTPPGPAKRELLHRLGSYYSTDLVAFYNDWMESGPGVEQTRIIEEIPPLIQIAPYTRLVLRNRFRWPSPESSQEGQDGFCAGLVSQLGVLSDGTIVPCCMDSTGSLSLGNIHSDRLDSILKRDRAIAIREGFLKGKAVEDYCRSCNYKDRFLNPER